MELRAALKEGIARLRRAGVASPALTAELLLLFAARRERAWLYAHPEDELSGEQLESYLSLLGKRSQGHPTQYLTGQQEFWGLAFEVNPQVLIPRPETEHLVEVALDRLAVRELCNSRPQKTDGADLWIADVGTGSGCLAVALAKELPLARLVATDLSAPALEVARRNAGRHGVLERIDFLLADLLEPLPAAGAPVRERAPLLFDLVVSNPPYIGREQAPGLMREVRDHEPGLALYGGEHGDELYAPLVDQAAKRLKPEGVLVLELGHDSLAAVRPLLGPSDWSLVGVTQDLAGIPRVIAAERT